MDRLTFGISILQSLWWKRDRSTAAVSAVACKRALVRAAGWGCSSVHGAQRPAPKTEGCWHPPTPSHLFLPPTHSSAGGEAHLQLYFPILFNREKKNHKKSGISLPLPNNTETTSTVEEDNRVLRPPNALAVEQSFG